MEPQKTSFHLVAHDKILQDFWSILSDSSSGFYPRHFWSILSDLSSGFYPAILNAENNPGTPLAENLAFGLRVIMVFPFHLPLFYGFDFTEEHVI